MTEGKAVISLEEYETLKNIETTLNKKIDSLELKLDKNCAYIYVYSAGNRHVQPKIEVSKTISEAVTEQLTKINDELEKDHKAQQRLDKLKYTIKNKTGFFRRLVYLITKEIPRIEEY